MGGRTIYKRLPLKETTAAQQKEKFPENQPLGNQTFWALMDFQGQLKHEDATVATLGK